MSSRLEKKNPLHLSPQQFPVLLLRGRKVRRSVGPQLFQVGLRPLGRAPTPPRLSDRRRYRWDEGEGSSYLSGADDMDTGSEARVGGASAAPTTQQLVRRNYSPVGPLHRERSIKHGASPRPPPRQKSFRGPHRALSPHGMALPPFLRSTDVKDSRTPNRKNMLSTQIGLNATLSSRAAKMRPHHTSLLFLLTRLQPLRDRQA